MDQPRLPDQPRTFELTLSDAVAHESSSASSWLISLVLHAALLVLFATTFSEIPLPPVELSAGSAGPEGILLTQADVIPEEANPEQAAIETPAAEPLTIEQAQLPVESEPHLAAAPPLSAIPAEIKVEPQSSFVTAPPAGVAESGPALQSGLNGNQARTSVFGIEGQGETFVYVFDRSGSMGGSGRNPLGAAKLELLNSLGNLSTSHQFQIIFYNERPTMFSFAGRPGALVLGNEQSKAEAVRFVNGITADGGTQHEVALQTALRLRPEVIFFLTDGADPEMSAAQLSRIRDVNSGRTSINTIEFGLGPPHSRYNFLFRLADENRGQYRYIDISQLDELTRQSATP